MEKSAQLPEDIVVLRHAETPGNVNSRLLKNKGLDFYDEQFMSVSQVRWPITERGQEQTACAGAYADREFGEGFFERFYVSTYDRPIETAIGLGLPYANWRLDDRLIERSHGDYDVLPPRERADYEHFMINLRAAEQSPFFHRPLNGESFSDVVHNRITPWLGTLGREAVRSTLAVTHGEWISAFQMKMENISGVEWQTVRNEPQRKVWNCQFFHYTRRNPYTGELSDRITHWRTIRPWRESGAKKLIVPAETGAEIWYERQNKTYTNEELRQLLNARAQVNLGELALTRSLANPDGIEA
jgi:broad specificity phosphatase PhoE